MKSDKVLENLILPKSFTELKEITGLSDAGLYKALKKFTEEGLVQKMEDGRYVITEEGLRRLRNIKGKYFSGIWVEYYGLDEDKVNEVLKVLSNVNREFYIKVQRKPLNLTEDLLMIVLASIIEDELSRKEGNPK